MKTFYEHWQDGDTIEKIVLPSLDPTNVPWYKSGIGVYENCEFLLAQEFGENGYVYWVAAISDGKEIARWNTAYIEQIIWKGEK